MNGYLLLTLSIACEIFSTSMLKLSSGFTKPLPSLAFAAGMGIAFYSLSHALSYIPLNVAYAIWSGVGTVLTAVIGILIWKESIDLYGAVGIALIVLGVVVLNMKGSVH